MYWRMTISRGTGTVIKDKTIPSNRPDITLMNKKNKEHLFDRHSCPEHT
jgi:hypothetical protein